MEKKLNTNPAGVVDLAELDTLANCDSAATTSPVCATILVTVISIESTVTVFTYSVCK